MRKYRTINREFKTEYIKVGKKIEGTIFAVIEGLKYDASKAEKEWYDNVFKAGLHSDGIVI